MRSHPLVLAVLLLTACGASGNNYSSVTTVPGTSTVLPNTASSTTTPRTTTIPSTTAMPTTTAAATTTTVGFSRESRLAVGACQDLLDKNFYRAVAVDSIGLSVSATLKAAQKVCVVAEQQLKADHAPEGVPTAILLAYTVTLNEALTTAQTLIAGGHLLDPPCPDGASCADAVLGRAVTTYVDQATRLLR